MNTHPTRKEHDLPQSPPRSTHLPQRFGVGAIVSLVGVAVVLLTSAPGWAAPRPKPTPTATASPTPSPSPTISPTPTPTTTPTPTPTPAPTPTPSGTCASTVTVGTVAYCVATFTDITAGRYPVGTGVAVSGAWVFDVATAAEVSLARSECPPGMYCGATLVSLTADFSQSPPTPTVDSFIDVYGTVTAGWGIHVDTYQ